MKIVEISLQNIKSFNQKEVCKFDEGLNFIIGSNGSGKSNLIEIIQAYINNIFLYPGVNFSDKNENNRYFFGVTRKSNNMNDLNENIIIPHFFSKDLEMSVIIHMKIEKKDIENIKNLKKITQQLTDFEKNETDGNTFQQLIANIDFSENYHSFCNSIIKLEYKGSQLNEQDFDRKTKCLIEYLRSSVIFYQYIDFYNSTRNDNQITNFTQLFYYFPPNREALDISKPREIDLNSAGSVSSNQAYQPQMTQNTRGTNSGGLLSKLAENYFLDNGKNENFRKLIQKHIDVDFSITPIGSIYQNKFRISFFRQEPGKQIPIRFSSGEKELFNFVSSIYFHNIDSGVIIIDEPEVHLHPKWQKKLHDLLIDISNISKNQIIGVTHSDQFIRSNNLESIIRVYKNEYQSQVFIADKQTLKNQSIQDTFLLLKSENNTKVFFADKVILVEGIVDRILIYAILEKIQRKIANSKIIEVIDVDGKSNFKKFSNFLKSWAINNYQIGDYDYLSIVGNNEIKNKIKYNPKMIYKTKDSKDSIKSLETENIFILTKGTIEKYFQTKKLNMSNAINLANQISNDSLDVPIEIKRIIMKIINN